MAFSYFDCDDNLKERVRSESEWLDEKLSALERECTTNPFAEDKYAQEALKMVRLWYNSVLALRIAITCIPVINLLVIGFFKLLTNKSWFKIDAVNQLKSIIQNKQENKNFVNLDAAQITLQEQLGAGAYGAVYRASNNGQLVAAKVSVDKISPRLSPKLADDLKREGEFLSRINSPYVLRCFGYFISREQSGILIEYIEHGSVKGGTLTALLKSDEVLNWNQQSNISWEMAMGFNALHQANIVHSDNKTDNILVYSETEVSTANVKWHIKISDLGLSHITQETARRGTPLWWAPEVFKDQGTTSIKSDVYAMGLVFWSVVSREKPFQEYQEVDEFQEDLTVQAVRPTMGKKFDEVPQRFASLIKRCWAQQPRQRPGCVEIIRELDEIQESDRFSAPVLH